MNKQTIIFAAVGTACTGIGFAAGYLTASKRREVYGGEASAEVVDLEELIEKLAYSTTENIDEDPMVSEVEASVAEKLDAQRAEAAERVVSDMLENRGSAPVVKNVFDEADKEEPDTDEPYLISEDEFFADDDRRSAALTYYAGDDTLCDENEVPVQDIEATVGSENLAVLFTPEGGTTLYVRNRRLDANFEIVLDMGKYSHQVLGEEAEEDELRHSAARRPVRKMRLSDF